MKAPFAHGTTMPEINPRLMSAAAKLALATPDLVELRQHEGASRIVITTPAQAITIWILRGLEHSYEVVTNKLMMARVGLSRWKQMQFDLLQAPGSYVMPIDYCPEMPPDLVERLKTDEEMLDLNDKSCSAVLDKLMDTLCLGAAEHFTELGLENVEFMVRDLTSRVAALVDVRESLRLARVQQWPGSTEADWKAYRAELVN